MMLPTPSVLVSVACAGILLAGSALAASTEPVMQAQDGRWTYYTQEPVVIYTASPGVRELEIRALPLEHSLLRQTLLSGQRRKLSAVEQAYVDKALAKLGAGKESVVIEAGDGSVTVAVPETGEPALVRLALDAQGEVRLPAGMLPPGIYEIRLAGGEQPVVRTLTVRTPLDHNDFLMQGTDLHAATADHREMFLMLEAGVNTVQAHYRTAEGADALAALGLEGVNCNIQPKLQEEWKPVREDGVRGGRQFYNVSFNNRDSMAGMSEYVQGKGKEQLLHPFNSTSLTINEVADMVRIDYGPDAKRDWAAYLERTYGTLDKLKADWGIRADEAIDSFDAIAMPLPPGGVGGSFVVHLMMDRDKEETMQKANTEPEWIRAAWWHWLRFKDESMRDWLNHALTEFDAVVQGRAATGNKYIHPHHDPGITFRCNWFVGEQRTAGSIFTYDSYNPVWQFGAYFGDLAAQLHPTPWVLETNKLGGPARESAAELYSLYSHGLTGVAFFKWQPYREGPYYFGFLEPDWTPGEKYESVAAMYRLAEQTAPSLLHLDVERSPVAVVYPHSDLVQNTERNLELLSDWHAFYGAFTGRHMVPEIFNEEFLDKPIPEWIKVIVLSDVRHLRAQDISRLQSWVRRDGGTLIIAGNTGEMDRYGRKSTALLDNFGYSVGERKLPVVRITADSLAANVFRSGEWFIYDGEYRRTAPALLDVLPVGKEWKVYRTTAMNNIALMERSLGKGKVIVVPWSPGARFREDGSGAQLRQLWFDILANEGVKPVLQVTPAETALDAVLRWGNDGRSLFVSGANHGAAGQYTFTVPLPQGVPMQAVRYGADGADPLQIDLSDDGTLGSFGLELGEYDIFAVSFFPQEDQPRVIAVDGVDNAAAIISEGMPWTVQITDVQGLSLARPMHGVGNRRVEWEDYSIAKRPFTAELTTPQGKRKFTLP